MSALTSCPARILAVLPGDMRDLVLSSNSHLETALKLRAAQREWGALDIGPEEVRVGWVHLGHMMRRALPLGPLGESTARYVSRSKVHHRDCYLLRSPALETAPLGEIAHRPYCSVCYGPGFDLSGSHLDYLWAVMAVDDISDDVTGLLRRSRGFDDPETLQGWQQERRAEIAACDQAITTVTALASVEPRIARFADDVTTRIRHRLAGIETRLSSGPKVGELPPGEIASKGHDAVLEWRVARSRASSNQGFTSAGDVLSALMIKPSSGSAVRLIDTPRTQSRALSPSYITGVTHQRIELARAVMDAGKVRADPALAHPVWGASYEWMAAKLAQKHPPSAGRALIWVTVTGSITHQACDSSCGNGLPVCDMFHPYPGHASLLVQVPEKRVLVSNWAGWDLLVFGGYIPVDEEDSRAFGQGLIDRFGDNVPSPADWPDDLIEKARESWIRCLRVPQDLFGRPAAGTQFVTSELRTSDVVDVVQGPPLEDANRWWDHYLKHNPDEEDRRERSTATLDDLRR